MTRKTLGIASGVAFLAMLGIGIAVALSLGGEVRLPTHWGIDGRPDVFSDKWSALLGPAVLTGLVSLLFYFLPSLEPRREGLARSQGLYLWAWAALLLVGAAIQLVVVSTALGWELPVNRIVIGAVGAMLVLIGNQLGKSRSMYMAGIRTPWTLASEEVWVKTHRLGGKLVVGAGLVAIAAALLPLPLESLPLILGAAIIVAALVPVIYSFLLWRAEKRRQSSG